MGDARGWGDACGDCGDTVKKGGIMFRLCVPVIVFLAFLGIFLSGYLFLAHYGIFSPSSLLFRLCPSSGAFSCEAVNAGRYAAFLGLPVAAYGLFCYISMLLFLLFSRLFRGDTFAAVTRLLLMAAAGLSALAVLPLSWVSALLVRSACLFCILTWAVNVLLLAAVLALLKGEGGMRAFDGLGKAAVPSGAISMLSRYAPHLLLLGIALGCTASSVILASGYLDAKREIERRETGERVENDLLSNFYARPVAGPGLEGVPVYYGDPKARISVVIYFDFNCGACRGGIAVMRGIADRYPGRVKLYLKNFPLDAACNARYSGEGSGLACRAALVSLRLRGSGDYPAFLDYLMLREKRITPGNLALALKYAGIDGARAEGIFADGGLRRILAEEVEEAVRLGVDATPSLVVNGRALPSGLPPASFLDRLIAMEIDRLYRCR